MSNQSSSSSSAGPLPQPTEAVLLAFIVAVALAELSRAALAPLPDLGEHWQMHAEGLLVVAQLLVQWSTGQDAMQALLCAGAC
jgi:hypothetical protein